MRILIAETEAPAAGGPSAVARDCAYKFDFVHQL